MFQCYPLLFCFAITNITPDARPTRTLSRLGRFHPDSNKNKPSIETGILFKDPTRLNVVGVVVDKNHSTENEIPNDTSPVSEATARNAGLYRSGCWGRVVSSP